MIISKVFGKRKWSLLAWNEDQVKERQWPEERNKKASVAK